jgi:hypothetical protein
LIALGTEKSEVEIMKKLLGIAQLLLPFLLLAGSLAKFVNNFEPSRDFLLPQADRMKRDF